MKLRNKKTGEIKKMWKDNICLSFGDCNKVYYSLKELNEEWEYAEPAEPLIEGEKYRKAVRAWAEVNILSVVRYNKTKDCIHSVYGSDDNDTNVCISFDDIYVFNKLKDRKEYTITELCGDEEE